MANTISATELPLYYVAHRLRVASLQHTNSDELLLESDAENFPSHGARHGTYSHMPLTVLRPKEIFKQKLHGGEKLFD